MARIIPDGWKELEVVPGTGAYREIQTLALLEKGLPDTYTVYHAVHWTNIERGFAVFGECDFVIVNRSGNMLLIEQKAGYLTETDDGLAKAYSGKTKSVPAQMARSVDALRRKLNKREDLQWAHIDSLLYCPDYTVKNAVAAGVAPERIVDATRRQRLASIIREILPEGEAANTKALHNFLRDLVQLEADVSAMIGRAENLVTRISGGLAHWARQLDFDPFRLRVLATAGSGKTQLALAEFNAALSAGKRPLYVCFNRPLADHFESIANDGGLACTFHALCEAVLRENGKAPDYGRTDPFSRLVEEARALPVPESLLFDAVIVDEGQDFPETWKDMVFRHQRPEARLLWMEDPMQNLYGQPSVSLPAWVTIQSRTNYRSPREVVRFLSTILPDDLGIEAASPFPSGDVEFLTYKDDDEMLQQVKVGIRNCFSAGFRNADVAVVTWHGRERSKLLSREQLGSVTLRKFSGSFDLLGKPMYASGDILADSVYRFKGQSAPAVVLAEIDFDELDDRAIRKLFVGATRAMMKLVLVLSERSAALLLAR